MVVASDEERGLNGVALDKDEKTPLLDPKNEKVQEKTVQANLEVGIENGRYKMFVGGAYMLAMGMCGVILVALGSTLEKLAEDAGLVSTDVGSVFIARGFGAIFGAIGSAKIYKAFPGNSVITWTILAMCSILLWLPFVSNVIMLHLGFLALGICTAVTDTGCQIMTRRVHGKSAGPWLGANTVAFGLSGAIVPCIAYLTTELIVQYSIVSAIGILAAMAFIVLPAPDKQQGFISKMKPRQKGTAASQVGLIGFLNYYKIEFYFSFIVFWLIGGKVGATAYLTQYVTDTRIFPENETSALIAVLWIAISVGRLFGILFQRKTNLKDLYCCTKTLLIGGAVGAALPIFLSHSPVALWVSVALFGFLNGPTVGFCYDLTNRMTTPGETGMSIIMFGLNCGASFIPFLISGIWEMFNFPLILFIIMTVSHLLPVPVLYASKSTYERNMKKVNI